MGRAALLTTGALVAGCQVQTTAGLSARDAEIARLRAETFQVVSLRPRRAVIEAAGQTVAVVPAAGSCIAIDAVDTGERSAFLLLTDCAMAEIGGEGGLETEAASVAGITAGRLDMTPAFPGLVTLSIAGEARGEIDALMDFLTTEDGRAQLARSEAASAVDIEETREIDGALYVHARQADDDAVPLLSRDFWRAFIDIGGRMGVVTVSGFRAGTLDAEALFAEVHRQVVALTTAGQGAALSAKAVPVEVPDLGVREVGGEADDGRG